MPFPSILEVSVVTLSQPAPNANIGIMGWNPVRSKETNQDTGEMS